MFQACSLNASLWCQHNCRSVCDGCYLMAAYGVNRFVVTYPPQLQALYKAAVTSASIFGRLVNAEHIVNVAVNFTHNTQVQYAACTASAAS